MTGQHLEPLAAGALRQPDRIRHQNVGKLADQGIEEIEPGPGGERLGQLGQQRVLQQWQLLGEIGRQLGAAAGIERRNPATTHLLGRYVLATPEHVTHLAVLVAEVADELGRLLGVIESGEKVGKAGLVICRQLPEPGVRPLPLPELVGGMIGQAPLGMLPIIKPHHLSGLLFHVLLQHHNNHVQVPDDSIAPTFSARTSARAVRGEVRKMRD